MIVASNFRATKLPLSYGAGLMPALGFGTLIADRAETISATRNALRQGFDILTVRNGTATSVKWGQRCRQDLPPKESRAKTSLLPQSYGTRTIGLSAWNRHSRRA